MSLPFRSVGLSPGRLAHAQALLDYAFGIAEHYAEYLPECGIPSADEKWNDDDVVSFLRGKNIR